jgi:hypothetical protein
VNLEQGQISLVSTTEELLERKSSGSCLENRECVRRDRESYHYTSPTRGDRSVGIVRSRTEGHGMFAFLYYEFL